MTDANPSAGLIPDRLLNEVKEHDSVLFLGADLPLGYPGAPLSWPELAAALAKQYDLPPGLSWPQTAPAYLGRFPHDRHGLVEFLLERSSGPKVLAGPIHQAIGRAGFQAIVSAWYDETLERELQAQGCRVHRVVRDKQLPFAKTGEREVVLVKLYGCLSDPESLAITPWDINGLLVELPQKLKFIAAFCNIKRLLFAGHDLRDTVLQVLYKHASRDVEQYMPRSYAIWPAPTAEMKAAWQEQNLELVDCQPGDFLQALARQAPAAAVSLSPAIHVHRPPYKFLDYYGPADADIFCGRDTESQIVTRLALSGRILTLFGPSGAGKTSLLLAGVLPRLAGESYRQVYVRALDDPLPALRKAVAARAGRQDWQTGETLRDFFSAMLGEKDRLVVVLDQFEELFLRVGSKARQAFFEQTAAALAQAERDVRFIFSLREDYLAYLDEASVYLPDIFNNRFRLSALDRGHARVAITEPAARAGVEVEAALVDALVGRPEARPDRFSENLSGLNSSTGDLVESDGRVPPPALQIVLDRLYRAALPAGADPEGPPPANMTLTLAAYRDFTCCVGEGEAKQELRGAKAILADYLDDGLEKLAGLKNEAGQLLQADPELAWEMLKALVTSRSTKAALALKELEKLLEEAGAVRADDGADRRRLEATRLGLAQVRLLRSFERDGQAYCELAHDHLAAAVSARLSQEEIGAKLARELLRPALDNWRAAKLLIALEGLKLIDARREDLQRLSAEELELLLRSALAAGYKAGYWFQRAAAGGVEVQAIALEGLKAENFRVRAAAVGALAGLGERFGGAITGMLVDLYPQVRAAAIQALEVLQPTGEWRAQLKYECYVPAGKFILGDDHSSPDNERPAHEIDLEDFYIGKYPVTNAEYGRYMSDLGRAFEFPAGKEHHPVVSVSWYDARDYAAWAGMRLLTETEWEKAASWEPDLSGFLKPDRSRKRKYPWGDAFDQNKCNTRESGIGGTTPVGKHSPAGDSPYGCADMSGNVWEWTSSLMKGYPYNANDGREDPHSGDPRVRRGGSWYLNEDSARCACRLNYNPSLRNDACGFRVGVSCPSRSEKH